MVRHWCSANTPAEIIDKLNAEINRALADPKILASLDRLGAMPMVGTPAGFGTLSLKSRTSGRRSSGPPTSSRNDAWGGSAAKPISAIQDPIKVGFVAPIVTRVIAFLPVFF